MTNFDQQAASEQHRVEGQIASELARRAFDHDHSPATLALSIPADLARRAYAGTSFDPEGRAKRAIADYGAQLHADTEYLREQAAIGGADAPEVEAQIDRYAAGFQQRVLALLYSESRCVSSFIAGPSNFPVRRMQIRADVARRRADELGDFRHRAKSAALRVLRPDLRPIMAGDADACERLTLEIDRAEREHARMKAANNVIRANAKKGIAHQVAALMELGFAEEKCHEVLVPDFVGRAGFPGYALTNSSAGIRRMKLRLKSLQVAKATPITEAVGPGGIRLEDDPPANRVRLRFPDDARPDKALRRVMQSTGFRWANTLTAWQAYRNTRAIQVARQIAGVAG